MARDRSCSRISEAHQGLSRPTRVRLAYPGYKRLALRRRGGHLSPLPPEIRRQPRTGLLAHLDHLQVPHRVIETHRPIVDRDLPDADIVIATWWETAEWVHRLSPSKGRKLFFVQHHELFEGQDPSRVKAAWQLPIQKITISRWLVDLARETYGDSSAILVPNSVEMKQFHAPARGRQTVPTVGFLYARAKFKGLEVTHRAIELARQTIPNLRVSAFGHDELLEAYPLPPGSSYAMQPAQDQIKDIYAQCDVWLCGSRSEGFHLPPLEAMACRCPVVSTRVGGPLDIIEEGVNGHLVNVEDAPALADRLVSVLQRSDEAWRAMSDAALATAMRYTWDDATDLFEKALVEQFERQQLPNGPIRQTQT